MKRGLVDQDIQPASHLRTHVDDIELTFGVDDGEEALISRLDGIDILFTTSRLPVTREVLSRADLDLVAKVGTGLDSIDLSAAEELGVPVVYTPGLNALSVAEHAVSLLLAVKRKIVSGQETLEAGGWRDEMSTNQMTAGKTVGIIGFGNVGTRVAGLLSGFNVDLFAYDPYIHEVDTQVTGADLVSLEYLLERSDAVVVTAELTEETRGMIDEDVLSTMKDDAVLVNTARGEIVDQPALATAVRNGTIAGAGLDVFETEPLPVSSELHDLDRVVLTPHIAASATEAREAVIETLAETVRTFLSGGTVDDRFIAASPR